MNYTVQAYTIHVGDVLASGRKVTSVASGPRFTVVTTDDGNYVIPNNKLVSIK